MADNDGAGNGDGQQSGSEGEGSEREFEPITSQEQLDKALGKRLERERAKFADYEDLKAKAAKFDKVEQANKSELEKAQERIAELEKNTAKAERQALAARIANEEGVIPEVLQGSTEEEMRASAKRVIEWRDQGKKPAPKPKTLTSGSGGEPKSGEKGKAAAALRQLRQG